MTNLSVLSVLALLLLSIVYIEGLISNEPVLPVPLNIGVWTSGLDQIDPAVLTSNLKNILPRYFPASEGGKPVHDIQLLLNYEVKKAPASFVQHYEIFVQNAPANSDGVHVLYIDDIARFVQTQLENEEFKLSFPTFDIFTIPILIINSERIEKHMIIQSVEQSDLCTMSVLSSVAFLDLTAKVCDITKAVSHDSNLVRWATPILSAPYPFTYPLSEKTLYEPQSTAYKNHVTARLASLVTSAIQALTTSDLHWRPAHATEKIYCPIVVMRNGGTDKNVKAIQPNTAAIKKWIQSILLPNQEVIIVTTDHYIDEHPQLSVAIASSQMTYATKVLGNNENKSNHIERIPFIDSNLLFHELTSVGDRLCDVLLHQTGHGEALRDLQQIEGVRDETREPLVPKVKSGRKEYSSKEKGWRPAAVIPVFVISDLHIHHERLLSPSTSTSTSNTDEKNNKDSGSGSSSRKNPDIPVQPLFNKDEAIAVDSDSSSVLVLHSSSPTVSTFSPHTKSWRENNLSDLDSLIAEGLTRALTGFNSPHTQLESSDILDLTWTHGMHPFSPYGKLSNAPDQQHSLLSTSIQRGILISKAHRAMQRAISISHRSMAIETEMADSYRYLYSLHGSTRQVRIIDIFI